MILSKEAIIEEIAKWNIIIHDWNQLITDWTKLKTLKDQSIDVRLWEWIFKNNEFQNISKENERNNYFFPNNFILAHTQEFVWTKAGSWILPTFKLKSSAWRMWIIHTLAGHWEVWFHNRWAMEFTLANNIYLEQFMSIWQIYFTRVEWWENEDYSKTWTYQKSNNIDEIVQNWKKEDILPPKNLKIINNII